VRKVQGSAAVEFALVGSVMIVLMLAIAGFAHWIFTMEMVADATRTGARMAVVCDVNDTTIRQTIQNKVPQLQLTNAQVSVQYFPNGCDRTNCQSVTVSIAGATYTPWFRAGAASFPVPPFTSTLPRESMESVNAAGFANPVCS
jgi:Flp pilus assembly protein TadG